MSESNCNDCAKIIATGDGFRQKNKISHRILMSFQPIFEKNSEVHKVQKGWGHELWIANNEKYCGKILHYDCKGVVSSFHAHFVKRESFLAMGRFFFRYKDQDGNTKQQILEYGDVVHVPACTPHQLEPLEDGAEIFEVSTPHDDNDVIRIEPGASQRRHSQEILNEFKQTSSLHLTGGMDTARELLRQILAEAKSQDAEHKLREKEKNNVITGDSWIVHYLKELQVLLSGDTQKET